MRVVFLKIVFILFITTIVNAQDSIPEYAKELSTFIQFPSVQYEEREAALYFSNLCQSKGLNVTVLDTTDKSYNFIASIYPLSSGKPNIVFLNHHDVVSPGDTSQWVHPPYSGIIKDNYVWGRGAIDNKGMAIAELYAIAQFASENKSKELPFNVSILSVSDEEMGGHRGAILVSEYHLNKFNPVFMLGEGGSGVRGILYTDPERAVFGTSTSEKKKLVLKLELDVESSGHGSVPLDHYATKDMVIALQRLLERKKEIILTKVPVHALKIMGRAEKGIRGFVLRNFTFFAFKPIVKKEIKKDPMVSSFFTNTITLTNISAKETDHNQISSNISATLDCRLIPGTETKQFVRSVRRKLNNRDIKITVEHEENTGNRTFLPDYYIALCQALKSEYPKALNLEIIFPATTDNHLFRKKGIPVFGLFPAVFTEDELKSIHNINERIRIETLTKGINVYKNFLENVKEEGLTEKKVEAGIKEAKKGKN